MFKISEPELLIEVEEREVEFYLEDFLPIPKSALTMLTAPGGSGKSFLALQIAIRLVQDNVSKVLIWLSEDPKSLTKSRAKNILNKIQGVGTHLKNIYVKDDMPLHLNESTFSAYKELFIPYNLVIIDPLIAFFGGEENSNTQARYFMNMLNKIAKENLQSILIVHHTAKNREQENRSRGASAFVDAVRLVYELRNIEDEENDRLREIVITKDNYGVRHLIGESKNLVVIPSSYSKPKIIFETKKDETKKNKKPSVWEVL